MPLSGGAAKTLKFMLERPDGCDAVIREDEFEIRYRWNPARHRYLMELAPAVVSQLLRWSRLTGTVDRFKATIGPRQVVAPSYGDWFFDPRGLWIDACEPDIRIWVRAAMGPHQTLEDEPPDPLPAPPSTEQTFRELVNPMPCPHCQGASDRFRELRSGILVCAVCGCSFDRAVHWKPTRLETDPRGR